MMPPSLSPIQVLSVSFRLPGTGRLVEKDMDVYGETGYILVSNSTKMQVKNTKSAPARSREISVSEVGIYQDPFSYFADVVKGKIQVPKNGLYSLENNLTVVRILDAARESAKSGKTVFFKKK